MTTYLTAGHGNRSIDEFVALLKEAAIERLVDVRAYPASRRHPQFARAALERSLGEAGIRYEWEGKALGGRRKPAPDSPHVALRSPAFRAYADHMTTGEFRAGIERVEAAAQTSRVVVMCAERLPWECHRFLISDYLVAAGATVVHLVNPGSTREHRLNPVARLRDGKLVYDGATQDDLKFK
jgi:uncharacterized protein (DUF488 family)